MRLNILKWGIFFQICLPCSKLWCLIILHFQAKTLSVRSSLPSPAQNWGQPVLLTRQVIVSLASQNSMCLYCLASFWSAYGVRLFPWLKKTAPAWPDKYTVRSLVIQRPFCAEQQQPWDSLAPAELFVSNLFLPFSLPSTSLFLSSPFAVKHSPFQPHI